MLVPRLAVHSWENSHSVSNRHPPACLISVISFYQIVLIEWVSINNAISTSMVQTLVRAPNCEQFEAFRSKINQFGTGKNGYQLEPKQNRFPMTWCANHDNMGMSYFMDWKERPLICQVTVFYIFLSVIVGPCLFFG